MRAQEKLGKTVTVRNSPSASAPSASGGDTGDVVLPHAIVDYVMVVDDREHPGDIKYSWLKLAELRYVNFVYPPNGARFNLIPDVPPSGNKDIDHIDVVYKDASADRFVPE